MRVPVNVLALNASKLLFLNRKLILVSVDVKFDRTLSWKVPKKLAETFQLDLISSKTLKRQMVLIASERGVFPLSSDVVYKAIRLTTLCGKRNKTIGF